MDTADLDLGCSARGGSNPARTASAAELESPLTEDLQDRDDPVNSWRTFATITSSPAPNPTPPGRLVAQRLVPVGPRPSSNSRRAAADQATGYSAALRSRRGVEPAEGQVQLPVVYVLLTPTEGNAFPADSYFYVAEQAKREVLAVALSAITSRRIVNAGLELPPSGGAPYTVCDGMFLAGG